MTLIEMIRRQIVMVMGMIMAIVMFMAVMMTRDADD